MLLKLQSTTNMDSIVLEEPSSSSTAYGGSSGSGGGRAIDRHNPIIRDQKRLGQGRIFPSSPTTDHPYLNLKAEAKAGDDQKRKSIVFADGDGDGDDFISPETSSRCLLSHKATFNFSSEFDHVLAPPLEPFKSHNSKAFTNKDNDLLSSPPPPPPPTPQSPPFRFLNRDHHSPSSSPPKPPPLPPLSSVTTKPSPQPPPPSSNQVVVLEVSLHCRGCERKLRKHISKIEGVTSFQIEFTANKVTVVGDVTPLAVLRSVLKVKNAKLLTPAIISSSSSSSQTGSISNQACTSGSRT